MNNFNLHEESLESVNITSAKSQCSSRALCSDAERSTKKYRKNEEDSSEESLSESIINFGKLIDTRVVAEKLRRNNVENVENDSACAQSPEEKFPLTNNSNLELCETIEEEGEAWQYLIRDLGPDFLNGHRIATVKQKVLSNSYENKKVPFLAGMVKEVDRSHGNTLVVLEDRTGTIEGIVDKRASDEFPYFFNRGVILFMADVSLEEGRVFITLKIIINIYTCRCRHFDISVMNSRLRRLNVPTRIHESPIRLLETKFQRSLLMQRFREALNADTQSHHTSSKNGDNLGKNVDKTCRPMVVEKFPANKNNHINLEASKNYTLEGTNPLKNNNEKSNRSQHNANSVQCTDHTTIKSTSESGDLRFFDDGLDACFLDVNLDNLVSKVTTHIDPITNNEIKPHASILMNENTLAVKNLSVPNTTHSYLKLPQETKHFVSKAPNICDESTDILHLTGRKTVIANKDTSSSLNKSNLIEASDNKLKLSVFKSKMESTAKPCKPPDIASTNEIHKQSESSFISGLLSNVGTDSDEELCQIDLASIYSEHGIAQC